MIKSIHGDAFQNLDQLETVFLGKNVCIDEDFEHSSRVAEMPLVVTRKCGLIEQALEKLEKQEEIMNKTISEKAVCLSENAKLNAELVAASDSKNECENQFALFKDLGDKLETTYNNLLALMTQDLRKLVDLKTNEIENLQAELQRKDEELKGKELKIKTLEEQINHP